MSQQRALRASLRADGVGTGIFGLFMLVGGQGLADAIGVPGSWTVPIGLGMLGGAVLLLVFSGHPVLPPVAAAVNSVAAVAMVGLTLGGLLPLTGLGVAFMLAGAAWVTTFAVLVLVLLRRAEGTR
ncbi:hypothetical protein GCM10010156_51620 [Planobispora rosea]|uniref:Uncharacterized protein n=1 Tax=Planobispora rosea TaxID=35762 RepID=A0A8J3S4M4_PLARO|nr:hypothetical protein [Planobispora rosea]GGS86749.1 hypothetical protein GCM10010156_51620 [Planobispora rosea]GIH88316.1 hypothetical protein Pro02_67240 [Planobispora rosea]